MTYRFPAGHTVLAGRNIMKTTRVEAFSDGVLAIIITIMVLELRIPDGGELGDLVGVSGTGLLSYILSFVYVGLYWNNHHHLFQLTDRIRGGVLWANLHLLFWLSLLPFTTAWMDETGFARVPVMVYGANLLGAALAFVILQSMIISSQGEESAVQRAVGKDLKGKISAVLYVVGIAIAFFIGSSIIPVLLSMTCFIAVAVIWVVPDPRMEKVILEIEAAN